MICQPPEDWVQRRSVPTSEVEAQENDSKKSEKDILSHDHTDDDDCYIHWKDALKSKEFYLLWITRLSVVLITQVVSVQGLVILEKKLKFPLCNNKNIYETANKKCIFFGIIGCGFI